MRFIKLLLCLFSALCLTNCARGGSDEYPEYALIKRLSRRLNKKAGLELSSYGSTPRPTEECLGKYGKSAFDASYYVLKSQQDIISLEEARCLLVSVVESFLNEVNSNQEMKGRLNVYPLTYDWLEVRVRYKDKNRIELGNGGISGMFVREGKIKYETYEIYEYTGKYPADGRHFDVCEEPYEEALKTVKSQGCLQIF